MPDEEEDNEESGVNSGNEDEGATNESPKSRKSKYDKEVDGVATTTEFEAEVDRNLSSKFLIKEYADVYKSIKIERFPTALVINRNDENKINLIASRPINKKDKKKEEQQEQLEVQDTDETTERQVSESELNTVTNLAGELVKSIIERAVCEVRSSQQVTPREDLPDYLKRSSYLVNSKISSAKKSDILNEFNANKSNSRLSYYKDFQTDLDVVMSEYGGDDDANDDNQKLVIEFEDEPPE